MEKNQPEKDIGLQAKLNKRKKKLAYWQKFKDQNTLPKIIFGGRKQFIKRCKGQMSQDEYRASRDNRLLSRGDITKKGNPNTRLLQGIEREAIRQGIEVIKVNPAYTSVIGRCKYQKQYGLSTRQSAALVIGRRGYGYSEKLPKAVEKKQTSLVTMACGQQNHQQIKKGR